MKHNETKATAIPPAVKYKVYERDRHRCIVCGMYIRQDDDGSYIGGGPHAHYIRRSKGGLGIEENVVTLCDKCHHDYDNGYHRREIGDWISEYLERFYPDFDDYDRVYHKHKKLAEID